MFGKKKPTEFDEAQDKQLQQLMANQKWLIAKIQHLEKNQNILIPNNDINIEKRDKIALAVTDLQKRMSANEKKDAEQAQLFANLSRSATQTEVAEETT